MWDLCSFVPLFPIFKTGIILPYFLNSKVRGFFLQLTWWGKKPLVLGSDTSQGGSQLLQLQPRLRVRIGGPWPPFVTSSPLPPLALLSPWCLRFPLSLCHALNTSTHLLSVPPNCYLSSVVALAPALLQPTPSQPGSGSNNGSTSGPSSSSHLVLRLGPGLGLGLEPGLLLL